MKKVLFVILDGVAEPKGNSALKKAKKPYLDLIASQSECGLWSGPYAPNFNPRSMSSIGTLEVLGYSYKDEPGRGYLEALGIDIKPKKNQIFLRANFAAVDKKLKIIDRRAGRDAYGLDILVKELNKKIKKINGVKTKIYRSAGHRCVLVLEGKVNKRITDNDIGEKPSKIYPQSKEAERTAEILNIYIEKSHKILKENKINKKRKLPANFILVRSAGSMQKVINFKKAYGLKACSISSVGIIKGISKYLGLDIFYYNENELETNIEEKTLKAIEALKKYDFVLLHINGADTYSHEKKYKEKVKYIEKIDSELFSYLYELKNIIIAVIGDHETSSKTGEHKFGIVPFLLYSPDNIIERKTNFSEDNKDFITENPMGKIMAEIK